MDAELGDLRPVDSPVVGGRARQTSPRRVERRVDAATPAVMTGAWNVEDVTVYEQLASA
jgi:hypothetical protein